MVDGARTHARTVFLASIELRARFFGILILIGMLGCTNGGENADVCAFSGIVLYEGRPVTYGQLTLYPTHGPPVPAAAIQPDGSFTTHAAEGEYKVVVTAIPPPDGAVPNPLAEGGFDYSHSKPAKSLVPLKYSRPETSDVSVTLTADNQSSLYISL